MKSFLLFLLIFCLSNELANGARLNKRKKGGNQNMEDASSSRRKENSPAVQHKPPARNFPQLEFSLVEITVLTHIMLNLKIEDFTNNPDKDLLGFLRVLGNSYLFSIPPYTATFNKLENVIEYYKNEQEKIYNLEQQHIYENSDANKKREIIKKRLTEIGKTMIAEKFKEKLKVFVKIPKGIVKTDDVINHVMTKTKDVDLDAIYNGFCKELNNSEKNIFVVWNLFYFMRMLINQFAAFHESYDYYNCIYNYLLERGIYVEISIEKYFDAYNKLETQANIFKPYLSTEINAEQNMYPAIFSHSIDNNLYIYLDFTFIKQAGNGGQNIIVEDQISHVSGQNFDYGGHNSSDGTGNGANGWQINASEDHSSHASCQNFFYSSQNSFDGSQDN